MEKKENTFNGGHIGYVADPEAIRQMVALKEAIEVAGSVEGSDGGPLPCNDRLPKAWVAIENGRVLGYYTEADAEKSAIAQARIHPGKTILVLKAVKAFQTDEPAVKSIPVEG
jgi:hypothetical protein